MKVKIDLTYISTDHLLNILKFRDYDPTDLCHEVIVKEPKSYCIDIECLDDPQDFIEDISTRNLIRELQTRGMFRREDYFDQDPEPDTLFDWEKLDYIKKVLRLKSWNDRDKVIKELDKLFY